MRCQHGQEITECFACLNASIRTELARERQFKSVRNLARQSTRPLGSLAKRGPTTVSDLLLNMERDCYRMPYQPWEHESVTQIMQVCQRRYGYDEPELVRRLVRDVANETDMDVADLMTRSVGEFARVSWNRFGPTRDEALAMANACE